jgi:hypothetical protein
MLNIKCPNDIIEGSKITKEKRHELYGKVAGGSGSTKPELYQRSKIIEGTGVSCNKCDIRINKRTNSLDKSAHPMKKENGYDYTENFDGYQEINNKNIYLNLKSVVGAGGSQTRTLRDECYPFVEAQLNFLKLYPESNTYFANIFDGDQAAKNMNKFQYLCSLDEYCSIKSRVYVGDLKGYFDWLKIIVES